MKKALAIIAVILLFASLSMYVYAEGPDTNQTKGISVYPDLSFSGITATCSADVTANYSDVVFVTMQLWRGSTLLSTWYDYGTGEVSMSEQKTVTSGYWYKVTVDAIINGVAQPTRSVSKYH